MRGGLRTRLVTDSVRLTVIAGLEALGWFDPTIHDTPPGTRRHRPLHYVPTPTSWSDAVEPNSVAISADDINDEPQSLGGDVEDHVRFYIDVFAQGDALGWELSMDVRDILLGNMPQIGRVGPVIDIYDLRMATPAPFTTVDVEDVTIDRAESDARAWQDHWFMVHAVILDDYADEFDADHSLTVWNEDFAPAWARIQAIELP